MLSILFYTLLRIGIRVSLLIIVVMLARKISDQRYNRAMCLLWGLAFIRLICPFSFESSVPLQDPLSNVVARIDAAEKTALRANATRRKR